METQHWVSEALAYGYISATDVTPLSSALVQIGRMLNSMTEKADSFCGSPEGEPDALVDRGTKSKMTLLGGTWRGLGKRRQIVF